MTEIQGGLVECRAGAGYHNPAPEPFSVRSGRSGTHTPVQDGTTNHPPQHLDRSGTVMLRYLVGDVSV